MIMRNNKYLLHGSLVFFVVWMLLMPPLSLAKSSNDSELPPELQNLPRIMELVPDPDSEVKLDEAMVINDPKGKGQTVKFSVTLQPNEQPRGYSLEMDFVRGTYKAVRETLTEEMIQQLESRYFPEDSKISTDAIGWRLTAALVTEDPVNWPLCQTTMTLFWYTDYTASLYESPWAANPIQGYPLVY